MQTGFSFGVGSILLTVVLLIFLIQGLVHRLMPVAVFSLAFIVIIYAKHLGVTALVPWAILGAALLLSIGLSLIIRPRAFDKFQQIHRQQHQYRKQYYKENHHYPEDTQTIVEEDLVVAARMSNTVRYLKTDDFTHAEITAYMAGVKIYFDDVTVNEAGANINVESSFAGIDLYVPSDWNMIINMDNSLSGIEEKGKLATKQGPTVTVTGALSLSGLTVVYI